LSFAAVVATGHATIWWIYALSLLFGLVLAIERPAMQAIVFQLVGPDLLPNAVAANSTIASVSGLLGPALAGALIGTVGVEACFYVNASSHLIVIGALIVLRKSELVERPLAGRAKGKLREGFAYVHAHPDVARPTLTTGCGRMSTGSCVARSAYRMTGAYIGGMKLSLIVSTQYALPINAGPMRVPAYTFMVVV
jgi:MFS family permease